MTVPFNSIVFRIVGAVALVLALAGTLIGWALYRNVRHSIHEEMETKLSARLAWIQGALDLDDGRLDFEPKVPQSRIPQDWRVETTDGKLLWTLPGTAPWSEADAAFEYESKLVELGNSNGRPLTASDVKLSTETPGTPFATYTATDKEGKLTLRLTVRESSAHSRQELQRVFIALWTIGPIAILVLITTLAFFIRWQLKPLTGMSRQAALIGPKNTDGRIGPAGTSIELVRLRDSINSMVTRLAEAMQRERQFSSMAAHELRTPLTQMRLSVEIALSKERPGSEYKEALSAALSDIERLQKLVVNLLFLTREHGGHGMNHAVSLQKVVQQAMRNCGSSAKIVGDLKQMDVHGNEELLESAVRNVFENARRYAPAEPPEVQAWDAGNAIRLSIVDSGPGIPEADRERIFEPLTRLDESRLIGDEAEGFGLGLTVARYAVRACGGDLLCKSRTDGKGGAAFEFRFEKSNETTRDREGANAGTMSHAS